ncbi:MAG TPA: fumarylacetoacetate hydrolase family protein, partial [Dehalococcoidia bacterium]|nr:fumarylacetoacetate hydrolase family protein [Dehalococcoidia bacterium]
RRLIDLGVAYACLLHEKLGWGESLTKAEALFPKDAGAFLAAGTAVRAAAEEAIAYVDRNAGRDLRDGQGRPAVRTVSAVRLAAPIQRPGKIVAEGLNYRRHAAEAGLVPPQFPMGFLKVATSIVGPEANVVRPRGISTLDYEVELGVVMGRAGTNIGEDEALDYVGGYTIVNDVSVREIQLREMEARTILLGKNYPTHCPIGPWVVTADEIPDPQALTVETRVNGERRQHSSTGDMIFNVRQMIAYWSSLGFEPGDVISTGTPEGVAMGHKPDPQEWYLKPGDVMELEISGIGVLRNRIVDAAG